MLLNYLHWRAEVCEVNIIATGIHGRHLHMFGGQQRLLTSLCLVILHLLII